MEFRRTALSRQDNELAGDWFRRRRAAALHLFRRRFAEFGEILGQRRAHLDVAEAG